VDRNIAEDESALKELQELGVFSTPVTLINGAVVVGFDRDKLEQLLGLTGLGQAWWSCQSHGRLAAAVFHIVETNNSTSRAAAK